MISENKELEMGRTYHPQIIEQYGRYEDEALQRYVEDVGKRLAAVSHRDDLVYRFTVLDSPVINAFALPGGYIYITRGMMAYLNSEAELAAVLGHEIGHVTARHGVRQQSAAQAANLGYTLGAILLPGLRTAGAQDLFNVFGGALLSGYGREHELESDRLGAEYLARSGYPSEAMIEVIGVLKDQATFAEAEAKNKARIIRATMVCLLLTRIMTPGCRKWLKRLINTKPRFVKMKVQSVICSVSMEWCLGIVNHRAFDLVEISITVKCSLR